MNINVTDLRISIRISVNVIHTILVDLIHDLVCDLICVYTNPPIELLLQVIARCQALCNAGLHVVRQLGV